MPVGVTWSCHALAVPVVRSAVGILGLLFPGTTTPVTEPHKGAQRLLGHGGGVLPEVSSAVGLIGIVCPHIPVIRSSVSVFFCSVLQ